MDLKYDSDHPPTGWKCLVSLMEQSAMTLGWVESELIIEESYIQLKKIHEELK